MNHSKKGVVDTQLNWIFVLIVGGIILIFFIGAFNWYKTKKNTEFADEVLTKLRAVMTSSEVSENTAKVIAIPEVPLVFTCYLDTCGEFGCTSQFEFENTGVRQNTEVDIVFATNKIESDTLLTWSLPWKAPYKVADFLYLSNPRVRYILVYDGDDSRSMALAKKVDEILSANQYIKKEILEETEVPHVKDQNDYFIKFVLFFDPGAKQINIHETLRKKQNWDVIFVYGDENSGNLKFSKILGEMRVPDDKKTFTYLGTPFLVGAIFSETYEFYICNVKKAYIRWKMVNEVYWKRTEILQKSFAEDRLCEFFYNDNLLDKFKEINRTLRLENPPVEDLKDEISFIEDTNDRVENKDCPKVY
ncbi:MAG: hypothetical protein QXK37_02205 [Candidatus Woesearchaeota archaeon]